MKGKKTLLVLAALQAIIVLYALAGVMGKVASMYGFLSLGFLFFYGMEIAFLGVYALLWQQIIKRVDLTLAYANRATALIWSMLFAVVLFHERITPGNVLGIFLILAGTVVVNLDAA